jgi:hypothetical protein
MNSRIDFFQFDRRRPRARREAYAFSATLVAMAREILRISVNGG